MRYGRAALIQRHSINPLPLDAEWFRAVKIPAMGFCQNHPHHTPMEDEKGRAIPGSNPCKGRADPRPGIARAFAAGRAFVPAPVFDMFITG